MAIYYDQSEVKRIIAVLADRIAKAFDPAQPLNVVGIRTRGETVAQRLVAALQAKGFTQIGHGVLDITLYRDDLADIGPAPLAGPTEIAIPLDGLPLVLADDVLFTGRSVRAALNALVDFGRPSMIRLAVLVDRVGGRELPIAADFTGIQVTDVPADARVSVRLVEDDGKDEIVVEPNA